MPAAPTTRQDRARAEDSGWMHVPHGADVGLRAWAPTLPELLEQAGLGLTAVLTDPAGVAPREAVTLSLDADESDPETLLYDWLNALIYEMATRRMLFGACAVTLGNDSVRAECRGETVDRARHAPAVEVKGATYTGLRVDRTADGGWIAECILDV